VTDGAMTSAGTNAGTRARNRRRITTFVAGIAFAGLVVASVRTVARDEQGVVLRFGRVVTVEPPGIHVGLPWPLEVVERVKSAEVRTMPIGFKLTDQQRGVPPGADEVQWLTGDRNIVELQATVIYTVRDPVDYLFGTGERSDGRRSDFAIRTAAESVVTALLATMPIDEVFASGKTKIQIDAIERVQQLVDGFHLGVGIRGINIVEVNPPSSVVSAFNDVQSARADRERSISEAAGYSASVLPKARAEADRIARESEIFRSETVERARGEAQTFTKLSQEVAKHPDLGRRRLWLETMQTVVARGRKVVVGSGTHETVFIGR